MPEQTSAHDRLIAALAENFTTTELHSLIITAERPDNRGATWWQRLRRAAMDAADCTECRR